VATGMAQKFLTPKLLHQGKCCVVPGGEEQPQWYFGSLSILEKDHKYWITVTI